MIFFNFHEKNSWLILQKHINSVLITMPSNKMDNFSPKRCDFHILVSEEIILGDLTFCHSTIMQDYAHPEWHNKLFDQISYKNRNLDQSRITRSLSLLLWKDFLQYGYQILVDKIILTKKVFEIKHGLPLLERILVFVSDIFPEWILGLNRHCRWP